MIKARLLRIGRKPIYDASYKKSEINPQMTFIFEIFNQNKEKKIEVK